MGVYCAAIHGGNAVFFQFHKLQKLGRENLELTVRVLSATSGTTQAITNELADYSRSVLQQSASLCEKLADARTLDDKVDVQNDHAKAALDDFVGQSKRLGELYQNLARDAARSLSGVLATQVVVPGEMAASGEPSVSRECSKAAGKQAARPVEKNVVKDAVARAVKEMAETAEQAPPTIN